MSRMNKFLLLLILVVGLIFLYSPSLFAQDEAEEFTLEEITVTAEKRTVDIQKTAMSITAVTGEEIATQSVPDIKTLLTTVPGADVQGSMFGTNVYIRGMGSFLTNNPSVPIQVDNVALKDSSSSLLSLYDVERVEVLRGPQGTMYGTQAMGGQVNIINKKPTDIYEGTFNMSIGDYNLRSFNGVLNVPLADKLAARISINRELRDGYYSNGGNSSDSYATRMKVSYKPIDSVSFLLSAEYTRDRSAGPVTVPIPGSAGNLPSYDTRSFPWVDLTIPETGWVTPESEGPDPWTTDIYSFTGRNRITYKIYSIEMDWDTGWSQLTLIPTYTESARQMGGGDMVLGKAVTTAFNETGNPAFGQKQKNLEGRIQNPADSNFKWLVGFFYQKQDNSGGMGGPPGGGGGGTPLESSENTNGGWYSAVAARPQDSRALFGQATYPVTPRFRLVYGMRWNDEIQNRGYWFANWNITDPTDPYYDKATIVDGRRQYDSGQTEYTNHAKNISYKPGIEFDINDNSMLYAGMSTGYKPGGMNIVDITMTEYKAETLKAYSLGTKNRFMNNRMQLNAEAYLYDYKNYQVENMIMYFDADTNSMRMAGVWQNAGGTKNKGLEVDLDYLVTDRTKFTVNYAYMDTAWGDVVVTDRLGRAGAINLKGETMPKAPTHSGTLTLEHVMPFSNGAQVTAKLQTKISGGYWVSHELFNVGTWQDSYKKSDIYFTYQPQSGSYSLSFWVKNLENTVVTDMAFSSYKRLINPPRTLGVNFSVGF